MRWIFGPKYNSPTLQVVVPPDRGDGARVQYAGQNVYSWDATQWGLGWLADSYVLGDHGIRPRLESAQAISLWDRYTVDAEGALTPRDYQRVMLMMLVIEGEYWEIITEDDQIMPMWAPSRTEYDTSTGMPRSYTWQRSGMPQLVVGPDRVRHLYLRTQPAQRRGDRLFDLVAPMAEERRAYIRALVSLAKLISTMRIFHRRGGGNPVVSATAAPTSEEAVTVDFSESGITPIGPRDEIISPSISASPTSVRDVERAAGGYIGMPYGISRMQATRDFSDANYSSARLANLIDSQTWRRYQRVIGHAMDLIWERWPMRATYALEMQPDWVYPELPSVDPHREAMVDRTQIEMGVVSRQQVMRRLGHEPETVMREIDEWRARYPRGL